MNPFKIYIDRLKDGRSKEIIETVPPDFLNMHESGLDFSDPVVIKGEVYLANDHLIISLSSKTQASISCKICNKFFKTSITACNISVALPLSEFKEPVFDYSEEVREALLLEIPSFVECENCPERESVDKFLKQTKQPVIEAQNFPFSDL